MNYLQSDKELAKYFIENVKSDEIISTLFEFFEINCLERGQISPAEFDQKISQFKESNYKSEPILTEIITTIKAGKNRQENILLTEAMEYIDEHFCEDVSIEEIAAGIPVSYYYLSHIFKKYKGISVSEYRKEKRLEKAFKMIVNTDKAITDIAFESGFNSASYFSDSFSKKVGISPKVLRANKRNIIVHDFYILEDMIASLKYESFRFPCSNVKTANYNFFSTMVQEPSDKYKFLHECAIIAYHGQLFASWYQCPVHELMGHTPICGRRSSDGGKTWSDIEIIAEDDSDKILYCPPVYGIDDDKLYMFINQMTAPDHIHSLDLYVLNNQTDKFELVWSRSIPFKLNTNIARLPNGKIMLSGRVGNLDAFPNTPAVMISDSGRIDDEWRIVKIAENGVLPDGTELVHPEITPIILENTIYMLCRNDARAVPLVYISTDMGEHFSSVYACDIPIWKTKIYSGTLSDGRNYIVCNADERDRCKLVLYFTKPYSLEIKEKLELIDTRNVENAFLCHYPVAYEDDGKLYIIATIDITDKGRGAILFTIEL